MWNTFRIIRFLGYNPLNAQRGLGRPSGACRTILGLTQKESAHRMGVDLSTLAKWERGELAPMGDYAVRAERFLQTVEAACAPSSARLAARCVNDGHRAGKRAPGQTIFAHSWIDR